VVVVSAHLLDDAQGSAAIPPLEVTAGYRILSVIQRGLEYETLDVWSERRYARCVAKRLRPDRPARRAARARLIREGEILTALDHPHLVRGYELHRGRRPVVIMETLTGATLGYLLQGRGRMPTTDVAHLGSQLISSLRYIHDSGFLHLDIKPGNVIIDGGRVKVIDLSLAQPPGLCLPGVGTSAYLSPEQARGESVGSAADVWGIGLTLFEAATCVRPFGNLARPQGTARLDAAMQTASGTQERCSTCGCRTSYRQQTERAPRIASLRRLPKVLSFAIDAALDPAPGDRPTLAELGLAATACL
jgi:eukaryotic-like serine/threonine-protein kinase